MERDGAARKPWGATTQESQERLQLVMDASSDGLWDWDLRSGLAYLSPQYYAMLGYTPGEVRPDREFFEGLLHPEDRSRALATMNAHLAGQTAESVFECRMVTREGTVKWMLGRGKVVERDGAGAPLRMVGTISDITARKRMEEALRVSEERFRLALAAAPVLVFNQDRDLRYTWIGNPVLGLEAPAILGRTDEELLGEAMARPLTTIKRRVLETGRGERQEVWVSREAKLGCFDLMAEPLHDASGEVAGITCAAMDITERKRAEEALHALSARLLAAQDEERRRVARGLHDTTAQQLAALLMALHALDELAGAGHSPERELLAESLALAQQCSDGVRTLAYLLHPPVLDEMGLAGAVRDFADGLARRSRLRVDLELAPDLPQLPRAHELALFRMLQESLANVTRHSGSKTASVRLVREADRVLLEIKDTGRGIPPETLAASGRAGVGIAGMRERARQLGGSLELESTPRGTTVRATVPFPPGEPSR